jgi:predicted sulfurtransferase
VIGLMVVVFLISSGSGPGGGQQPTAVAGNTATVVAVNGTAQDTTPTEEPAPRMALADFKKLYDDPKKRPLIIDVRAKENYDAGHIEGAISFPESDVDTRVSELPKDKLVVAYCQ